MNLKKLLKIFSDKKCKKVYIKKLSANDNSKNQVYLGGSFEVINILPIKEITSDKEGDWKRTRFKSKIDFSWLDDEGQTNHAPEAQLILYPKYPEVRFSGFLKRVKHAPSDLMASRIEGRFLFLGITIEGKVVGYVVAPNSQIANEIEALKNIPTVGVFKELAIEGGLIEQNSKEKLLSQLKRIHSLGWIDAKRFDANKNILPCISTNCGGLTLEAELGITPNGYSEPDYLGWEIKQFSVNDFSKWHSEVITLITPEPTGGYYVEKGVESFIRKYGYIDKLGRESRMNFGGIYKYGIVHPSTNLKMIISGYDNTINKITNSNGFIGLIDGRENIAASWAFTSLLKHWNRKHANACYIPSKNRKDEVLYPFSKQQYYYGNNVILGTGTDFSLVLQQMSIGNFYYDPGIKLEFAIEGKRKQNIKRRSQFRIKSANLDGLYNKYEIVNLIKE
jgi:hypothetical protein